jgi:CDP-diglyceride synthetase
MAQLLPGLPWQFLALGLALCLMLSALGFKRVEYFVSLGYAASIAAQAVMFPLLYRHTMGGAARFQSGLLLAYGLRLGIFIALRERLPSFRQQRAENAVRGARVGGPLRVAIWLGVSFFYLLLFVPALFTMSAQKDRVALASLPAGLILMMAGLALETGADWQKSRFKKQHPSRLCDVGLQRSALPELPWRDGILVRSVGVRFVGLPHPARLGFRESGISVHRTGNDRSGPPPGIEARQEVWLRRRL